jgi:hypothetical protein
MTTSNSDQEPKGKPIGTNRRTISTKLPVLENKVKPSKTIFNKHYLTSKNIKNEKN